MSRKSHHSPDFNIIIVQLKRERMPGIAIPDDGFVDAVLAQLSNYPEEHKVVLHTWPLYCFNPCRPVPISFNMLWNASRAPHTEVCDLPQTLRGAFYAGNRTDAASPNAAPKTSFSVSEDTKDIQHAR